MEISNNTLIIYEKLKEWNIENIFTDVSLLPTFQDKSQLKLILKHCILHNYYDDIRYIVEHSRLNINNLIEDNILLDIVDENYRPLFKYLTSTFHMKVPLDITVKDNALLRMSAKLNDVDLFNHLTLNPNVLSPLDINHNEGESFIIACRSGADEVVQSALSHLDVKTLTLVDGLFSACEYGYGDIVANIVETKKIDMNYIFHSMLEMAYLNDHYSIVDYILNIPNAPSVDIDDIIGSNLLSTEGDIYLMSFMRYLVRHDPLKYCEYLPQVKTHCESMGRLSLFDTIAQLMSDEHITTPEVDIVIS